MITQSLAARRVMRRTIELVVKHVVRDAARRHQLLHLATDADVIQQHVLVFDLVDVVVEYAAPLPVDWHALRANFYNTRTCRQPTCFRINIACNSLLR
jgi:hypothetical protein